MTHFMKSLITGSVSMAAIVSVAHAQPAAPMGPPPPPPAPIMHHHMNPMMIALPGVTLSAEQKAKIRAILEANRPDPAQMKPQDNPRHQLLELLQAPGKVQRGQLNKLENQIAKEDAKRIHKNVSVALAIRGVLTPEQLQQASENRMKLQDLHRQVAAILRPNDGGPDAPPPAPPAP